MKFRKHIAILVLTAVLVSILSVSATAEEGEAFSVKARAALLVELNTGKVLYELDPDEQNFPASLTKVMTVMLGLKYGDLDQKAVVSETALAGLDEMGNDAFLTVGEEMTLENILYCCMVASVNEACNVVAETISGSIEAFVELMNQEAAALGCTNTHFANAHGLHQNEHYTTVHDLALITQAALQDERFAAICNTPEYMLPATNFSDTRKLTTTNQLISNALYNSYKYSKAAGVKTGFTSQAQRCLISTADNGNIRLLAVLVGVEQIWDEKTGMYDLRSFPECINLFEWGFKNFQYKTLLSTLYPVAEIPVNESAGAQTVALAPTEEIRDIVPSVFNEEDIKLDIRLVSDSVDAPIEAGTVLGQVTVTYLDEVRGVRDLAAITTVVRSEITHQITKTKSLVAGNWWKWLLVALLLMLLLAVTGFFVLRYMRKQERHRKVAARRRALEQRRRQEEWRNSWSDRRE